MKNTRETRAFSLIEVSIALAMVSVAFVAVIGVLTTGTKLVGEAGDVTIKGRIAQNLIGELQLADWDKLDDYNLAANRFRYYDYAGKELADIDQEMQIYTALTRVDEAGLVLPGTSSPQTGLKNASVFISAKPGVQGKLEVGTMADDYSKNRNVSVFSKVLVKMKSDATSP